jgi:hypothetical protein
MTVKLQKYLIDFEGAIEFAMQVMFAALRVCYLSPKKVFAHVRPDISHKLYGLS